MKQLFYILLCVIFFISCTDTDERPHITYEVSFKNNTNTSVEIKGYTIYNELEYEYEINSMESGGNFNYKAETFDGYRQRADSIVFKFPNNKGYVCTDRVSGNNLCFNEKSPLGNNSSFNNLGNNHFEFEITQEDFDNALDLP